MRSQVLSIAKLLALLWLLAVGTAHAQQQRAYLLGPGDVVRITVFQNVDMTTDTRVSDQGMVTFPLNTPILVSVNMRCHGHLN